MVVSLIFEIFHLTLKTVQWISPWIPQKLIIFNWFQEVSLFRYSILSWITLLLFSLMKKRSWMFGIGILTCYLITFQQQHKCKLIQLYNNSMCIVRYLSLNVFSGNKGFLRVFCCWCIRWIRISKNHKFWKKLHFDNHRIPSGNRIYGHYLSSGRNFTF